MGPVTLDRCAAKDRKGRFVIMLRMALKVDQKSIGSTVICIPRMVRLNSFIFAGSQIFSGKAIMFQVIYKLEMKNRS